MCSPFTLDKNLKRFFDKIDRLSYSLTVYSCLCTFVSVASKLASAPEGMVQNSLKDRLFAFPFPAREQEGRGREDVST